MVTDVLCIKVGKALNDFNTTCVHLCLKADSSIWLFLRTATVEKSQAFACLRAVPLAA